MSKWLHILGSVGIAAAAVVIPAVSQVVAAHPTVSTGLGVVYAIVGNLLQSPLRPSK